MVEKAMVTTDITTQKFYAFGSNNHTYIQFPPYYSKNSVLEYFLRGKKV